MPKISIIVPIYNVEKYLAKCLDSLINQTFSDIEIICINDGSPDNSLQIAQEYAKKDQRIVLTSQPNQGLSGARNTGLELATSPYIMFCDSDDYYAPNMCELMFKAIDENDVDVAVCGVKIEYLTQQPSNNPVDKNFKVEYLGKHDFTKDRILNINVMAWNKIYRKSIIDKYNLKFPVGLWYEDNAFYYTFTSVAKNFYGLEDKLYNYQQVEGSIMSITNSKNTTKVLDYIGVMEYVYDFYKQHNVSLNDFYWKLFIKFFNRGRRNLSLNNNQHLIYAKANKFLDKVNAVDFTGVSKSVMKQIKIIRKGKDPLHLSIKNILKRQLAKFKK